MKRRFKKNEELIFDCYGSIMKGNFISKEGSAIKIKIISSDYTFEKPGDEASINENFLKQK